MHVDTGESEMTFRTQVVATRLLKGCAGRVGGPTALVEISVDGDLPAVAPSHALLTIVRALHAKQPLYRVADRDWPDGFLVAAPADGEDNDGPVWLGRWAVALTVAIQRWGFDPVAGGEVISASPDRVVMAMGWRRQRFFAASLELALRLIDTAVSQTAEPESRRTGQTDAGLARPITLTDYFGRDWAEIQATGLPRYTARLAEAAAARGMPVDVLPSYVQVGWGAHAERFDMTFTGRTSWMAATLARNKAKANELFAAAKLPTPRSRLVGSLQEAQQAAEELGWPIVVKPLNLDMGMGVVADIRGPESLARAYESSAALSSPTLLVERHEPGYCYRLLVVLGRVIAVARRLPAEVTGDARRTIAELVDAANKDPRRHGVLNQIALDDDALAYLDEQGLSAESVPAEARVVALRRTAYVFSGGSHENVAAITHPDNIALAVRAARLADLDIAGVDFITADISQSWRTGSGVICEINGQPALSPHWVAEPDRDITGEILDILFAGRPARIPTTAVIGPDAHEIALLLHRMFAAAGRMPGLSTCEGIWIGNDEVGTGDHTGVVGASALMMDPGVQAAIIELSPLKLAEEGHPCDRYDVAVLAGAPDHADVSARTARAVVRDAGGPYACDDVLVSQCGADADVFAHRRRGGRTVSVNGGSVIFGVSDVTTAITDWDGRRVSLYAAAAAWAHDLEVDVIERTLSATSTAVVPH